MDAADEQRQVGFEQAQDFALREAILFSEVSALKRKRFESLLRTIRSKCVILQQQQQALQDKQQTTLAVSDQFGLHSYSRISE